MSNINNTNRRAFLNSIRSEVGEERVTYLYDNMKYQLVEECLLKYLGTPGLKAVGFTARRTGRATEDQTTFVEDLTLNILTKLNVCFGTNTIEDMELRDIGYSNPKYQDCLISNQLTPFYRSNGVVVKNGVVFCNNINKGIVLDSVFSQSGNSFKKICLIDDKIKNLEDMAATVSNMSGVSFVGYHYEGAELLNNVVDPIVVNKQLANITATVPTITTDEETKLM